MRIFPPLKKDHPLTTEGEVCPVCKELFHAGQRIVLLPVRDEGKRVETVAALVLHATCSLKGRETEYGAIERIKDGDASPFPVVMTDGKQYKIEELFL